LPGAFFCCDPPAAYRAGFDFACRNDIIRSMQPGGGWARPLTATEIEEFEGL
jgi:hypothetical protein